MEQRIHVWLETRGLGVVAVAAVAAAAVGVEGNRSGCGTKRLGAARLEGPNRRSWPCSAKDPLLRSQKRRKR